MAYTVKNNNVMYIQHYRGLLGLWKLRGLEDKDHLETIMTFLETIMIFFQNNNSIIKKMLTLTHMQSLMSTVMYICNSLRSSMIIYNHL